MPKVSFAKFLSVLAALLALVQPLAAASGSDVALVHVWANYRTADSFKRISEYFTGREDTGGQIVLRTQPEDRAGYYFLVRLKSRTTEALPAGKIVLDIIKPDSVDPKHYEFPFAPGGKRSAVLLAGLTGADWPGPAIRPVAWQLQVLDADGKPLAKRQSFLWKYPTAAN